MLQLLWNVFAYMGASRLTDPSETKNVILLNSLAILVGFFSITTMILGNVLLPGFSAVNVAPAAYAVLIPLTLVFNALGMFTAARVYFATLSLFFLVFTFFVMGAPSDFHHFLLIGAMLTFFMFPSRERRWVYLFAGLDFIAYLVILFVFADYPGILATDEDDILILRYINGVTAVLLSFSFAGWVSGTYQTAERYLHIEKEKSERLLLNILPAPVAEKLRENPDAIAERFENCTILFSDIVGFTELSKELSAVEVVGMLNEIFSAFDDLAEKYELEKIKTIGDAYMVVGGLPEPHDEHAERVARFALEMMEIVRGFREKGHYPLELRIGIATGDAVAGVIGKKKFVYDLWGSSVNTASRMESHGLPGQIQVTESTYELLKGKFTLEERGIVDVKGLGEVRSYLLSGAA